MTVQLHRKLLGPVIGGLYHFSCGLTTVVVHIFPLAVVDIAVQRVHIFQTEIGKSERWIGVQLLYIPAEHIAGSIVIEMNEIAEIAAGKILCTVVPELLVHRRGGIQRKRTRRRACQQQCRQCRRGKLFHLFHIVTPSCWCYYHCTGNR